MFNRSGAASISGTKLFIVFLSVAVCLFFLLWQQYDFRQPFLVQKKEFHKNLSISIVVVMSDMTGEGKYQRALDSLKCYSKIHGYKFIIAQDKDYADVCKQPDKFFRRHCVIARYLGSCDYLLFLDADIGVVNPQRRIEEFIDDRFDVTFYDRFYNAEIMAGSYLVKNSPTALDFIIGFGNYDKQLPKSFHGTDNGALHAYIISKIFPDRYEDYKICIEAYNASRGYDDLFAFETCIRTIMGIGEEFGPYRILRKAKGWARDAWLTNSLWNPETDFMIHNWKSNEMNRYGKKDLPIDITNHAYRWYDPIVGKFDFDKCTLGNYSWNHDPNLIASASAIRNHLAAFKREIQGKNYKLLGKMPNLPK